MKEYQLFVLTPEGAVKERYTLKCADDQKAKSLAQKFVTVDTVEVWEGSRYVAGFLSKTSD